MRDHREKPRAAPAPTLDGQMAPERLDSIREPPKTVALRVGSTDAVFRMPPGNADDGLVAATEIRRTHPDVSVLVLSQHLEPTYMLELVGDDASGVGYLLKDRVRDVAEFVDAVERVAAGGTAFDPKVVNSLVAGRRRSRLDELTSRERAVLSLIAEGRSNRAIARQLHLSPRAIERHAQAIFLKLCLPDSEDNNRRVLAVLALLGH
jgi:DNA-binding NarL/FixJ family response regulator